MNLEGAFPQSRLYIVYHILDQNVERRKASKQEKEPPTISSHIRRQCQDSFLGHTCVKRMFSALLIKRSCAGDVYD